MSEVSLLVRKAKAMDIPFLTNSWLESFREGFMVSAIPNRAYYAHHHQVIEQLLSKATTLIVCPAEEPDIIMGWICAEVMEVYDEANKPVPALVIHYVYTKRTFRKAEVAKRLFTFLVEEEKPKMVLATHLTGVGARLLRKVNGTYNPYILFMDLPKEWNKKK